MQKFIEFELVTEEGDEEVTDTFVVEFTEEKFHSALCSLSDMIEGSQVKSLNWCEVEGRKKATRTRKLP